MTTSQRVFAFSIGLGLVSFTHCATTPDLPKLDPVEVAGDWSCVGSVEWPRTRPKAAVLAFRAAQALRYTDATLRACAKGDTQCVRPVDTASLRAAEGWEDEPFALLRVPTGTRGWDGYVELAITGHDRILAFAVPPVTGDRAVQELPENELFTYSDWLVAAAHAEVDPSRGQIGFDVFDCAGEPADGASVVLSAADDATSRIYLVGGEPTLGEDRTDAESGAMGMFVNVPPGRASLTVTVGEARDRVSEVTVVTRAGALTTVRLRPTPNLDPVDLSPVDVRGP